MVLVVRDKSLAAWKEWKKWQRCRQKPNGREDGWFQSLFMKFCCGCRMQCLVTGWHMSSREKIGCILRVSSN